jgi:hypothetical protein
VVFIIVSYRLDFLKKHTQLSEKKKRLAYAAGVKFTLSFDSMDEAVVGTN